MDPAFLFTALGRLIQGVPVTVGLAIGALCCGAVLALAFAALRVYGPRPLHWVVRAYVSVFRGTPLLLQLFLIYFGLGQFNLTLRAWGVWGFFREAHWCALLALTLNSSAYGSEILRGAFQSVAHGQIEAAKAFGMGPWTLLRRIIFPIAARQALPLYGNEAILVLKATAVASVVTVMDVTGIAQKLISETYRSFEVFVCSAAIYLVLNFAIIQFVALLERRFSTHLPPPSPSQAPALQPSETI